MDRVLVFGNRVLWCKVIKIGVGRVSVIVIAFGIHETWCYVLKCVCVSEDKFKSLKKKKVDPNPPNTPARTLKLKVVPNRKS